MEDVLSSLLELSLSSGPNLSVRFSSIFLLWGLKSKGVISALRSLMEEGDECASNSALEYSIFSRTITV
ncbi:hypothetical protein AYI68_g1763 [Smittium mucronatum]|uniref:Uncharacterized protein n=1 Tax=Smittium mucronatum TaxID=133383 RepID=A0A1R0H4V0_9FUNG|nr:hypothetical protein AYI68_g1763 [Smittium mucronatum]